jgi:hypothetical protein
MKNSSIKIYYNRARSKAFLLAASLAGYMILRLFFEAN